MANISVNDLFNFVQGSDIKGLSSYDIYKNLYPESSELGFLEFVKGKSIYQTWLEIEGNAGKTEEEFIAAMGVGPEFLEQLSAKDTNGLLGEANGSVNAQSLVDAIAQRVLDLEEITAIAESI